MLTNPLFELLKLKANQLSNYTLQSKLSKHSKNYFLVNANRAITQKDVLINDSQVFKVTDYHFSVYQDLKFKDEGLQSHFHLTMQLVNDQQQTFSLRIYYHTFKKILAISAKDASGTPIKIFEPESIRQFVHGYTLDFIGVISRLYAELQAEHNKHYELSMDTLNELSKLAYSSLAKTGDIEAYQAQLDRIITHLEQWQLYQLKPRVPLKLFLNLKQQIMQRSLPRTVENAVAPVEVIAEDDVIELKVSSKPKPRLLEHLAKLNQQLSQLLNDTKLNPCAKLVREHQLQTKKLNTCKDDEQALNCFVRIRELDKAAQRLINEYLILPHKHDRLKETDFIPLVKLITLHSAGSVFYCVSKNKPKLLDALLTHSTGINIDTPFTQDKVYLLTLAYDKKHDEVLSVLLKHGAFTDRQDEEGYTLLVRSCFDERFEVMVMLLRAGASTTLCNNMGYAAFGILTIRSELKGHNYINLRPAEQVVKLFLDNVTAKFDIDFMQGSDYTKTTPLIFACQNNWPRLVKLYLTHDKYKANPNFVRESDYNNALVLAAAKNYAEICEIILNHSNYDLKFSCQRALQVAKKLNHTKLIPMLEQYLTQHSYSFEATGRQYLFGVNATADFGFQMRASLPDVRLDNPLGSLFAEMHKQQISTRYQLKAEDEDESQDNSRNFGPT